MAESTTTGFDGESDVIGAESQGSRVEAGYTVTAKELHSCIIASESSRSVCSVLIALLVILSHMSHPLLGVNMASAVAAKPMYMVLLSDFTVVVAHLVLRRRRRAMVNEEDQVKRKLPQEEVNWTRAVMVLERGLVLHQAIRGLFIDCSVYVVTVACGLSLVS